MASGLKEIKANLKKAREQILKAVGAGVFGVGNEIMTEAKRNTPVDFGALKGSGYVTEPSIVGTTASVELGFGGPAKAYAVVQHESTEFNHEVGEAKFLENAVNRAAAGALARVGKIAARQLKAGGDSTLPSVHPTNPDAE